MGFEIIYHDTHVEARIYLGSKGKYAYEYDSTAPRAIKKLMGLIANTNCMEFIQSLTRDCTVEQPKKQNAVIFMQ